MRTAYRSREGVKSVSSMHCTLRRFEPIDQQTRVQQILTCENSVRRLEILALFLLHSNGYTSTHLLRVALYPQRNHADYNDIVCDLLPA